MTAFYWVDSKAEALTDAAAKGIAKWAYFDRRANLQSVNVKSLDGIYLKAGLIELEQEFAAIQYRERPQWSC